MGCQVLNLGQRQARQTFCLWCYLLALHGDTVKLQFVVNYYLLIQTDPVSSQGPNLFFFNFCLLGHTPKPKRHSDITPKPKRHSAITPRLTGSYAVPSTQRLNLGQTGAREVSVRYLICCTLSGHWDQPSSQEQTSVTYFVVTHSSPTPLHFHLLLKSLKVLDIHGLQFTRAILPSAPLISFPFLCLCFCLWACPSVLKGYSCLCTQQLLLAGSGTIWCVGNRTQVSRVQAKHLPTGYCSGPNY